MNQALLAQGLGIAAAIVGLSTYLHTKEKAFKIQAGCSSWIWGLHFGLLGSHSAALTQFAIGTRSWSSTGTRTTKYQHGLFWISSIVFCVLAVAGWDGWISLLPLAAAINSTAALVYAANREMRIRLLGSSVLWIGTGWYWHSWPIMLTEVIAISINLRTILRLQKI